MKTTLTCILCLLALLIVILGCSHLSKSQSTAHPDDPNPFVEEKNVRPADWIASAGHGAVFDAAGRPLGLDTEQVSEILASMADVLWRSSIEQVSGDTRSVLRSARKLLKARQFDPVDESLVRAAVVGQLLLEAPQTMRTQYSWRYRVVLTALHEDYVERAELLPDIARRLDIDIFIDFLNGSGGTSNAYIDRCRAEGVPIPRPWSESSSAWIYHGQLKEKLILPSSEAHVWTYADPNLRGGCIALPRGNGAAGTAAGIICQSATTGKACFWDNILAGTSGPIGWRGRTLNVADLRNGDTLIQNCTACHRGNNVFLISPDDATWAKVIRPAQQSNVGQTFSTHVENTSIARYEPVSSQSDWANVQAPACLGCHERPPVGFEPIPMMMPPSCRTSDVLPGRCYGAAHRYMPP